MINKMWYLLGLVIGVVGLLLSPFGVGAAVGPASGFMTLSNPETGQELVAWCEAGLVESFAVSDGTETHDVGAPLGTPCSAQPFAGFVPVVNTDPSVGWMIHAGAIDRDGTRMASICTSRGMSFAIKRPGYDMGIYSRPGDCGPDAIPG